MKLLITLIFGVAILFPLINAINKLILYQQYTVFKHLKTGKYLGWKGSSKDIIPSENFVQVFDLDNGNKILYVFPFLTPYGSVPVYALGLHGGDCKIAGSSAIERNTLRNRTDQYWRLNHDDTITNACDNFNYALTILDDGKLALRKKNQKQYSFAWEAIREGHAKSWVKPL